MAQFSEIDQRIRAKEGLDVQPPCMQAPTEEEVIRMTLLEKRSSQVDCESAAQPWVDRVNLRASLTSRDRGRGGVGVSGRTTTLTAAQRSDRERVWLSRSWCLQAELCLRTPAGPWQVHVRVVRPNA